MTRHALLAAGLTGLALTASATPAAAAPTRTFTFADAKTETFQPTGTGFASFSDGTVPVEQCTSGLRECDDTLIELKAPGKLTYKTADGDPAQADVALDLFTSDATGKVGKTLVHSDESTPTVVEAVSRDLEPGFYLVRVDFLVGSGAVEATAAFAPSGPAPAPSPTPGTPSTPPAGSAPAANAAPKAIIKLGKTFKAAKLKSLGGTASDDSKVAKVQVAVLRKTGKRCAALTTKGTFGKVGTCATPKTFLTAVGTSTWTLKLKKPFAKGAYVVYARAIDDKGLAQTPAAKLSLKVS